MPGLLTLIGSGETAPGMVRVHRALLDHLAEPPRPLFLDTPAGFELGLEAIRRRFRDYFARRLGVELTVASFRRRDEPPERVAEALQAIGAANYLIAGPGSPTYAIRHWRGSLVYQALLQRWEAGAHLVIASAASIAFSRYALPVYEIYKVGEDLHWVEGLDLLGRYGFALAIVPHWDNAEGGTHDTRACFMGMERFERLRRMLPPEAVVLGVDEHTACILDLEAGRAEVLGRGGVQVLRGEEQVHIPAGDTFALEVLRSGAAAPATSAPAAAEGPAEGTGGPAAAAAHIAAGDLAEGLRLAAQAADENLAPVLLQAAQAAENLDTPEEALAPLIDLILQVRQTLREKRAWDLADRLRDGLLELGVEVRDSPEGSTWVRQTSDD